MNAAPYVWADFGGRFKDSYVVLSTDSDGDLLRFTVTEAREMAAQLAERAEYVERALAHDRARVMEAWAKKGSPE